MRVAGSKYESRLLSTCKLQLATCNLYTCPMISTELTAVLLGLAAAVGWGTGDFSGGVATKRTGNYLVVFIMNLFGVIALIAAILIFGEKMPPPRDLFFGVLAGMSGAIGLATFLRGLSTGNMGAVAPLTAVIASSIPVIFSLFNEGAVEWLTMVGFALALIAIWIIASGGEAASPTWRDLKLPLIAGMGFGGFFILLGAANDNSILWPVLASRFGSVTLMALLITGSRGWKRPSADQWPILLTASVFDVGGNLFFVLAASIGRLDIAAVLASLYPAVTVLLARFILHEAITRWQWLGLMITLIAVVLIAW